MTGEPRQLVLDLGHREALGAEDFLVSGSNAAAVALIDRWPDWAHWAAFLQGPEGSGKTHLANVWRARSGAAAVTADTLGEATPGLLASAHALVVEDVDRGIADERVLFHLLNIAREHRLTMLLTARAEPGEIAISLPDLRSRLRALPLARIEPPDDALLGGVLIKLFADRQLEIEPHVVAYLGRHMDRSLGLAKRVVAAADRLALAMRRSVTRAVAAQALEQAMQEGGAGSCEGA